MNESFRRSAAAGFTLIEVLIALTITALALGTVLPVVSGSLDRTGSALREVQATSLAETILAQVGHSIALTDGESKGQAGELSWILAVVPWLQDGPAEIHGGVHAHRVTVTVTWPGVSRMQSQQLVTLRLAPPT